MQLTLQRAKEINEGHVTEESLILHSLNVCYAIKKDARCSEWKCVRWLRYALKVCAHTLKNLNCLGQSTEQTRNITQIGVVFD